MKRPIFTLFVALMCLSASAFKIDTLSIASKLIPVPDEVCVITPDGDGSYPTVYLLNGFTGSNLDWIKLEPMIGQYADDYQVIIVMPHGQNSWYWDSPKHPEMKMESFFVKELVPYIDKNYPTIPDRSKRAISGLSMGGQGAFYLAANHPEIWKNVASMSGGVDIVPFPKSWDMAKWLGPQETDMATWKEFSILNHVNKLKNGDFNITFDCGTDDFFAEVNNNLHQALLDAKVPHEYISRPGVHNWDYWRNSLLYHLLFFTEAFKK